MIKNIFQIQRTKSLRYHYHHKLVFLLMPDKHVLSLLLLWSLLLFSIRKAPHDIIFLGPSTLSWVLFMLHHTLRWPRILCCRAMMISPRKSLTLMQRRWIWICICYLYILHLQWFGWESWEGIHLYPIHRQCFCGWQPEDWDDEEDGEWATPNIPNPDYKGPWTQKVWTSPEFHFLLALRYMSSKYSSLH